MAEPSPTTDRASNVRRPGHRAFVAGHALQSGCACPICGFDDWTYLFISFGGPVYRCANCGLTRSNPQAVRPHGPVPSPDDTGGDFLGDDTRVVSSPTEQDAARYYLQVLETNRTSRSGVLLVAPREHPFATRAEEHGYTIETTVDARELPELTLAEGHYESAVIIFQLEQAENPVSMLEQIHTALKPDGVLLLVTPSIDSWSARIFRSQWPQWRRENLYYFDTQTIQSALLRTGFAQIQVTPDRRRYSLQHLFDRTRTLAPTRLTRLIRGMYQATPGPLRRGLRLELAASGILVTARRVERRKRPLLSIIMPVYNERPTFAATMDAVLAKEVGGVDKEIIVVESNSTDGTRELVLRYEDRPGVKVVLEDRPRGKGHAVRIGFEHAQGDLILIQDGDQEYDVNDYDALIEPIQCYQRAFVLGSRHIKGDWKVRKFIDQPALATLFNFGHFLFATALNLLYGQRLRDPFTMYKVFRRDCLHDLKFECNRFDFDFELVIKLVRKGYVPLEVPVNYQSRSLKQGKKVSVLRDPLTWLWALIRFRFRSQRASSG